MIATAFAVAGIVLIIGIIVSAIVTISTRCEANDSDLDAFVHKTQVDLARYAGKWFDIAHLPAPFQRDCAKSTAHYSLSTTGDYIDVRNECTTFNGKTRLATGKAWPVNSLNTRLKVSFSPILPQLFSGDYWILYVDDNYEHALVGTPDKKYLWILARKPVVEQAVLDAMVSHAFDLGYNVRRLESGYQ